MILGLVVAPALIKSLPTLASTENAGEDTFYQLTYPSPDELDGFQKFGYEPATEDEKSKAAEIIKNTPKGPMPIDIAQSFVDRFYLVDPKAISQWPVPESWNPLVVAFFSSTSLRPNNDMVAWCAAFANWCIERSGRNGSRSAASQSFLSDKYFKTTDNPNVGDLAIFTCYDKVSGTSLGFGHVAFVKEKPANGRIRVIGGNQSADGHYSIISDRYFSTGDRDVRRHVDGKYVACTMRLNSYITIV